MGKQITNSKHTYERWRAQKLSRIAVGALVGLCFACGATERNRDSEANDRGAQSAAPFVACTEDPQTEVPFERANPDASGHAPLLRWSRSGECIAVSYKADVEHLVPTLEVALAAYNAVECSALCFDSPRAANLLSNAEASRTLHVEAAESPLLTAVMAHTSYQEGTGELISTTLSVDLTRPAPSLSVLLHELGHVVGLAHVESVDSVMVPYESGLEALSALDEAAICKMYGNEPEVCVDG